MKRTIVSVTLYSYFILVGHNSFADNTEFTSGDYNSVRIENEYKLSFPPNKTEDVWNYLKNKYANNTDLFLKKYDSSFSTQLSEEFFVDVYYDTLFLDMLKRESGIRRRTRFIPNDKDNRKNGRSLLQVKLKRQGDLVTNRSEIKFPVNPIFSVNQGNEFNPARILKKKKYAEAFISRLEEIGIDAKNLKQKLVLVQRRRRVYVSKNGAPFATITLDEVSSEKLWKKIKFTEVEIELNEIKYTDASNTEKKAMQEVNEILRKDLQKKFGYVTVDQTPKYNKAFSAFEKGIWLFKIFLFFS